jgi:hypothetical protein|tara:strand:- start:282 stop:1424 length:1143 start_codon:yes stop_codon:yes gene_type:complete
MKVNKTLTEDFYWITYFNDKYEKNVIHLIESISKYSNRKCILYGINYDYQLPEEFLTSNQFIVKRIEIEKGDIDLRGRDASILSSKPKILADAIDTFPKNKFVYIDTDCYITVNADGVNKYFKDLENYPLINSHIHDRIFTRGIVEGEEWTSSVDILAKKIDVEICIFPRRKANLIVFDGSSKWFFEEQMEIYHKYKNTEDGIFGLHDEDSANVLLSKYKLPKCLPLCDVEETNVISTQEMTDTSNQFHMTKNISSECKLPEHSNDIITFHQLKTQEDFDDIKDNYGITVLDNEEVLIYYNNNTIVWKNNWKGNKKIGENVDFLIKNINEEIIEVLPNQNLYNYLTFYISNLNLNEGFYVIEIIKTNSREKIYNNLIEIK